MNTRKDERAQVYRVTKSENGTLEVLHRHFIYPQAKKTEGGLRVNYRGLESKEKVAIGVGFNLRSAQFRFNMNRNITEECKIVYRGVVYDIRTVDPFDGRQREMKVVAVENTDTATYGEDEYDGQV